MTNEQLCAMALAAIDDADARVVLADAVEESGPPPFDRRYGPLLWPHRLGEAAGLEGPWNSWWNDEPTMIGRCRAIAAVLLFGDWPTSWPLAERCRVVHWTRLYGDRLRSGTMADWERDRDAGYLTR